MAFLDAYLSLSSTQAVTTSAASTNVIDTLASAQAVEPGMWLRVAVTAAFTIPDAPLNDITAVQLQTSDDEDFEDSTTVTLAATSAIDEADATAGTELLVIKLPKNLKRYIRVYYVMGSTATAGNVDAYLTNNTDVLVTDVEGT